jgi:GAF domain-containing protein
MSSDSRGDAGRDVQAIQRIDAVTSILDIVCRTTGMGFAAVARVTEERWIACAVKDDIQFGLKPGGELKVETTICHEIRQSGTPVIIDHVAQDQAFCGHPTPAMYGFQSYISVPIVRADGSFFVRYAPSTHGRPSSELRRRSACLSCLPNLSPLNSIPPTGWRPARPVSSA